jgi:hypothetical protein
MFVYLAAPAQLYANPLSEPLQVHRLLISYVSATWKLPKFLAALQNAPQRDGYCFDSGAHGWLSNFLKSGVAPPIAQLEKHFANFLEVVNALPVKPRFVVELDVQKVYGMATVEAWRRDLWAPFEARTGIPVCYVWHPSDGSAAWDAMLDNPDMHYLGMGGTLESLDTRVWADQVHRAYKAGKPVHGFAKVSARHLKAIPFASVDSTSWAAGTFFGTIPYFDPTTGTMRQMHAGRRTFAKSPKTAASRVLRAGGKVSLNTLVAKNGKESFEPFYRHASVQYERLEQWFTAYWRARGVDWDPYLNPHLHSTR